MTYNATLYAYKCERSKELSVKGLKVMFIHVHNIMINSVIYRNTVYKLC